MNFGNIASRCICTGLVFLANRSPALEKHITVACDGSGDFRTVQEAFAAVPVRSADRTIIRIRPGNYQGQKILAKDRTGVTLIGDDAEKTILTWDINTNELQPPGTDERYKGTGLVVLGDDFRAEKLTFSNTSGDHGQALALRIDGDRAVVSGCRLSGWQDTLMSRGGRQYYRDCFIEGRVDFIYGSGTAVFDRCEIHSRNGGYVTAASTPAEHPFGFVFLDCKLTADPAPWVDPSGKFPMRKSTGKAPLAFLGRPWRPDASVIFVRCELGSHIDPRGWDNWRNPANEKTARFAEYACTGPGAESSRRVPWARQMDNTTGAEVTVSSVLSGADHWQPH